MIKQLAYHLDCDSQFHRWYLALFCTPLAAASPAWSFNTISNTSPAKVDFLG